MPRPSKKRAEELPLSSTMSAQYDTAIELSIASTQPYPFDEDIGEEKMYTVSDKKFVKTYYTNGNFQCQLTTKTSDILEIGTTLNLQQFKMLLDAYSTLVSTLNAAFYKGEKSYTIHDLTDGIYASVNSGFFCLDVREFYTDKKTGNPLPTQRGVAYNVKEVKILHDILESIDNLIKWL